jgi:SagB-type dehydrogenase family enzyme
MRRSNVLSGISFLALIAVVVITGNHAEADTRNSVGDRFHQETSITDRRLTKGGIKPKDQSSTQKDQAAMMSIKLPNPDYRGMPLEETLEERRSVRQYSDTALSIASLSQLLFAAQGESGSILGHALRTAPSAGALYPMEVYAVVNNVEGLEQGIYHYRVSNHTLDLVDRGDFRRAISKAGLGQTVLGDANVTFVLTAVFDRMRRKYGERGLRYIYMEAGHISQNIALQAVSLGLGSVSVGAFYDNQVNDLVGVDGQQEAAVYLHAVGSVK